jgi:ribonuclease HI
MGVTAEQRADGWGAREKHSVVGAFGALAEPVEDDQNERSRSGVRGHIPRDDSIGDHGWQCRGIAFQVPWIEATLRGQRVMARANPDRSLTVEGGRVEVRYRPNDGRAYRASPRNLEVADGATLFGDDACVPALSALAGQSAAPEDKKTATHRGAASTHATPSDAWIAYTDGACSGNPGPAGCGVVIVSPSGKAHEGLEFLGQATNNVAELTAILRAVEWIPSHARAVVVHTDSQYAIGVLEKGWKAKANQELVHRAKQLVHQRGARLVYVPGHRGVALNERADALAREAVRTGRSVRPEGIEA